MSDWNCRKGCRLPCPWTLGGDSCEQWRFSAIQEKLYDPEACCHFVSHTSPEKEPRNPARNDHEVPTCWGRCGWHVYVQMSPQTKMARFLLQKSVVLRISSTSSWFCWCSTWRSSFPPQISMRSAWELPKAFGLKAKPFLSGLKPGYTWKNTPLTIGKHTCVNLFCTAAWWFELHVLNCYLGLCKSQFDSHIFSSWLNKPPSRILLKDSVKFHHQKPSPVCFCSRF